MDADSSMRCIPASPIFTLLNSLIDSLLSYFFLPDIPVSVHVKQVIKVTDLGNRRWANFLPVPHHHGGWFQAIQGDFDVVVLVHLMDARATLKLTELRLTLSPASLPTSDLQCFRTTAPAYTGL